MRTITASAAKDLGHFLARIFVAFVSSHDKTAEFRARTVAASSCRAMIAFKVKSVGLSVAPARLAGTPSRIPTVATMTSRTPLPARRRSPNSAATTRASAGCRAMTTPGLRRSRFDPSRRNLKVLDKSGIEPRVGGSGRT